MKKFNLTDILMWILTHIWLVFAAIFVIVPLMWMVSAAFSPGKLLSGVPLLPDPSKFSLEHFKFIFSYKSNPASVMADYTGAFFRTLQIALL